MTKAERYITARPFVISLVSLLFVPTPYSLFAFFALLAFFASAFLNPHLRRQTLF
jgi:hypothetical protein